MNPMKVNLYASFRALVGAKSVELELPEGSSVKDLLVRLESAYPSLRGQLLTPQGEVAGHIHLFVNQRDVSYRPDGPGSPLQPEDTVDLFPAVGGGS